MKFPPLLPASVAIAIAHVSSLSTQADVSFRVVALTDSDAPGVGSGAAFQLFLNAGIGGAGDVTAEGLHLQAMKLFDLGISYGHW